MRSRQPELHRPRAGGRFVTVLPRSRREDNHFRKLLRTETPTCELLWNRPNAQRRDGPRELWSVYRDPLGSAEGVSLIWVWSTLLTLRQQARRYRNISTAIDALTDLRRRILGPRSRIRGGARIDLEVEMILEQHWVRRYLKVKRVPRPEHTFKQTQRGRPGADTGYRRVSLRRYDLEWTVDQAAIDYDKKSDGMYPLICNDRSLAPTQILKAHKGQWTASPTRWPPWKVGRESADDPWMPNAVLNQVRYYQRLSMLNLIARPSGLAEAELKPEDGDVPVI